MKKASSLTYKLISFFFLISTITFAHAQNMETDSNGSAVDNVLRSNGLIYVVVGVIVIILGGMILYLSSLDRKLTKLEKEIHNK